MSLSALHTWWLYSNRMKDLKTKQKVLLSAGQSQCKWGLGKFPQKAAQIPPRFFLPYWLNSEIKYLWFGNKTSEILSPFICPQGVGIFRGTENTRTQPRPFTGLYRSWVLPWCCFQSSRSPRLLFDWNDTVKGIYGLLLYFPFGKVSRNVFAKKIFRLKIIWFFAPIHNDRILLTDYVINLVEPYCTF